MTFPRNGTWLSTTQFAIDIVFLVITSAFLGLRLWSRFLQKATRPRALTVSDYIVTIGYLATIGNTFCMIAGKWRSLISARKAQADLTFEAIVAGGSGRHVQDLTEQEQEIGQKVGLWRL